MSYRIEQLEKRVDKHNSVIERVYRLEEKDAIHDEQMRVANHRIADLERREEKMKDWQKRALRTFLQSAVGYFCTAIVTIDWSADKADN